MKKGGQVTIFIIIAILIVAAVAGFFILKKSFVKEEIPADIQNIETDFLVCIEEEILAGIDVLETRGGYIETPEFEAGSDYSPFSSQLNFLGTPVPYWYYVSGNNIEKEQVPTKEEMEIQLEKFIEGQITNCNFENYYSSGYLIFRGTPKADVKINSDRVNVNVNMDLDISFSDESAIIQEHNVAVKSNLGKLYDASKKVYDYEQEKLFLEEYGIDILRLYAPVDGVELKCSPLHWNADEVFDELGEAIEANTLALKNFGESKDYFKVNLPVSEEVRFVNSRNWPNSFEVLPGEENILFANPVGNQPGLGILGFCYVPYHFIYNINYPVLIQVSEGEETFQFPIAVVIRGNNPRKPLEGEASGMESFGLCENKNTPVSVNVYDINSNPVDATVYYECFGERCYIGENSSLKENFPQCANGNLIVRAEGYKDARETFSSITGGNIAVYLDKVYTLPINLKIDNNNYNDNAIIIFASDELSKTVVYPEQKEIELTEGVYEVQVYVYKNSSINLESATKEQCIDVKSGIGGMLGINKKECFDIEIPSQIISNALAGGGKQEYYMLESELKNAKSIELNVKSLPEPKTIEQLQDNYEFFESKGVELIIK